MAIYQYITQDPKSLNFEQFRGGLLGIWISVRDGCEIEYLPFDRFSLIAHCSLNIGFKWHSKVPAESWNTDLSFDT